MEYQNDFEVRLAQLNALGDTTSRPQNIYETDLKILDKLQHGGSGAQIDDTTTALDKVWSSQKTNTEIQGAIAVGFKVEVVQELPATGLPKVLYLVPKQTAATGDVYDEYIWTDNGFEKIGSTEVDLSNYYTKTQTDEKIAQGVSGLASETYVNNAVTQGVTGKYDIKNGVTIQDNEVNVQEYGMLVAVQGSRLELNGGSGIYTYLSANGNLERLDLTGETPVQRSAAFEDIITAANGFTGLASETYVNNAVAQGVTGKVSSSTIENLWSGTQAEYDAIATKSNTTIYYITGATI